MQLALFKDIVCRRKRLRHRFVQVIYRLLPFRCAMILHHITEEFLIGRAIQSARVLYSDPFQMVAFHGEAQYIIYFDRLCRFIATTTLRIEIATDPASVPVFGTLTGCVPDIHTTEM